MSFKNHLTGILPALTAVLVFAACSSKVNDNLTPLPLSYGKINQVVVVADKDVWEGAVGDTFRFYYTSPYLILPQPEPVFDLKHFTPQMMQEDPLRKELHHYVFLANLGDENSPTTQMMLKDLGAEKINEAREGGKSQSVVGRNKWARDQLLIYLFGESEADLMSNIAKSFPAAEERIKSADAGRIEATVFQGGENRQIMDVVRTKFKAEMRIPKDYVVAIDDPNTLWLRKEAEELSSSILMTKVPYKSAEQASEKGLKALRDSIGRKYISSTSQGSYMVTNDVDLPMFVNKTMLNNRYALEARGIWEMENDFMGGPFISYLIVNEQSGEIFFADGFVFAPGKDKRNYIQYLEAILKTIKF